MQVNVLFLVPAALSPSERIRGTNFITGWLAPPPPHCLLGIWRRKGFIPAGNRNQFRRLFILCPVTILTEFSHLVTCCIARQKAPFAPNL
jgi:hypothetical protein